MIFVPKKVSEARLQQCKNCEYYLWTGQCKKSYCFVIVCVKVAFRSCPLGKWVAFKGESSDKKD